MFFVLGLIWLVLGVTPLFLAVRRDKKPATVIRRAVLFGVFVVILIAARIGLGLYSEALWFGAVGYAGRFWTEIRAQVLLFVVGFLGIGVLYYPLVRAAWEPTEATGQVGWLPWVLTGTLAVIAGAQATGIWQELLLFVNSEPSAVVDPIFGRPTSFYLFTLPFYRSLVGSLTFLTILAAIGAALAGTVSVGGKIESGSDFAAALRKSRGIRRPLLILGGVLAALIGFNFVISIFGLMFSTDGAVTGAGWLEVNVERITLSISAGLFFLLALTGFASAFVPRIFRAVFGLSFERSQIEGGSEEGRPQEGEQQTTPAPRESGALRPSRRTAILPIAVVAILIVVNGIVPGIARVLILNPNEITLETPYIPHNIEFTQRGFGLSEDRIETEQYSVGRSITSSVLEENQSTIENIRLWDWRALLDNLKQQQEIRLYYEFHDVDIDRYEMDGSERQLMLSVRELEKENIPSQADTWVSRRLKYTHGYGAVVLPVNEFLPQGGPDLLVQGIPPESEVPRLELTRPEVYYGESTIDHVYVGTTEQEFDYPSGDQNVYTSYEGDGGVAIGNLLRRLVFAWKFDEYQLVFSRYFTAESRVLFRRAITERVASLAPFLRFDADPYPVITPDGRIKYILDAYTLSSNYPYSQRYAGRVGKFAGANYLRNSVKIVIDAYHGSVDLYAVDPDDVLLSTFGRVFEGLFKPFAEMPESLQEHIRYPADLLTAQAEVYSIYHMEDVDTFYQREDVWQFPTERYRQNFQIVEPYYVMAQFPDREQTEFVLMLPFTPKNKNVMNAWMAGRSDMPNYGEIRVYTFPKGVSVLGPRQIEARIDQDTEMSRALSLWSQSGSQVIRGNLLTIPLFAGNDLFVMYAEPVFLQAEDAALPEIKRVVLADQDSVVWAQSFEAAMVNLLGQEATRVVTAPSAAAAAQPVGPLVPEVRQSAESAIGAFNRFTSALGKQDYGAAGEALEELQDAIATLNENMETEGEEQ